MPRPTPEELTAKLLAFIEYAGEELKIDDTYDSNWQKSGVYAVLDCVFSAQADYETVVKPTLERFADNSRIVADNSRIVDEESLTFDSFLSYIRVGDSERVGDSDRPTPERFEEVAASVFKNRQKISGRTKVEVAYDVCEFFARQGLQTKKELQELPEGKDGEPGKLEILVMDSIVNGTPETGKVRGMGLALGAYLLMCLGRTDFVKPDSLLLRIIKRITGGNWSPKMGNVEDYKLIRQAITSVAEQIGRTPAAIDNALWSYERERGEFLDRITWSSIDEVVITPPPEDENVPTKFRA